MSNSTLGQSLVLLSLAAASFGAVVGFISGYRQSLRGLRWSQTAGYIFALGMFGANLVMVRALLVHDFSVEYVAKVGSLSTPTWVTAVSLWSSLDGSVLFWGTILGGYIATFIYRTGPAEREYSAYAMGTMLTVATFFAFLIAGPAIPFNAVDPVTSCPDGIGSVLVQGLRYCEGRGPNPLLQNHILMTIHPPTLYLGFVGMTIPFSIAIAALLRGRLSDAWLKPLRNWTMIPWMFLFIGIILGGWWAYEVLGWGGYWAWDPVENASLLPWLAATGYLHATVVLERKRLLKAWTVALVLVSFLLTILGTFMTRSGVFNSVHSFTQSPIGPTFLIFLGFLLIVSFGLLAGRAHLLESEGELSSPVSREFAFIINNTLFVIFTFTVLLGTTFPLIVEALTDKKISVGEPYFNKMVIPLGIMLVFMMGIGPMLPWGTANTKTLIKRLTTPLVIALLTAIGAYGLVGIQDPLVLLSFSLCAFAATVTLIELFTPSMLRLKRKKNHSASNPTESTFSAIYKGLFSNRRRTGGYIVHLAVLILVAGITGSSAYKYSTEAILKPGDSMEIGEYKLTMRGVKAEDQPHRFSAYAHMEVLRAGKYLGVMKPRLNYYPTQREPIGTPHVRTFLDEDLYLSLLGFKENGSQATIKAFVLPMVAWIWWSLPLIALGSLIAIWPRRRKIYSPADTTQIAATPNSPASDGVKE